MVIFFVAGSIKENAPVRIPTLLSEITNAIKSERNDFLGVEITSLSPSDKTVGNLVLALFGFSKSVGVGSFSSKTSL